MAYKKVQFIAWVIHTGPAADPKDKTKQIYKGLKNSAEDIAERVKLVTQVIDQAKAAIGHSQTESDTLKIFMMPEFFFRGPTGAYDMDDVATLVAALQAAVKDASWKDWLFVFGSIVGKSFTTKEQSFFLRLFGPRFVVDTSKPVEIYNYCLIQKGGFGNDSGAGPASARAVMKQLKSGMDFIPKAKLSGSEIPFERAQPLEPTREFGTTSDIQITNYDGSSIFQIDGLTYGLEVCLDHFKQRLKNVAKLPPIDIQLVPSCGASIQNNAIVAKKDGFVFNCDGYADYDRQVLGGNSALVKVGTGAVTAPKSFTAVSSARASDLYGQGAGEIRVYPTQVLSQSMVSKL